MLKTPSSVTVLSVSVARGPAFPNRPFSVMVRGGDVGAQTCELCDLSIRDERLETGKDTKVWAFLCDSFPRLAASIQIRALYSKFFQVARGIKKGQQALNYRPAPDHDAERRHMRKSDCLQSSSVCIAWTT